MHTCTAASGSEAVHREGSVDNRDGSAVTGSRVQWGGRDGTISGTYRQ